MTKQMTKVVIIYQTTPPLAEYLIAAFQVLGIQAIKFNVDQNSWFDRWVIHPLNKQLHNLRILKKSKSLFESHPLAHRQFVNKRLEIVLTQERPDLIVSIHGPIYAISAIHKSGIPSIAWWVEPANRVQQIADEANVYRWIFCMNRESVHALQAQSCQHVSYLQHAVSANAFFPMPSATKRYDVCFVGGWTEKRQRILDIVLGVTKNVAVYGPGWLKKHPANLRHKQVFKGVSIYGERLNRLYNESRISLNITQWSAGEQPASGMNMRFLEIPATGSLLLTDYVQESEEVFRVGKEIVVYDENSLDHRLNDLLANPQEVADIAQAGYLRVKEGFTYGMVVDQILQVYKRVG